MASEPSEPSEQQDRLVEPRSSACSELARAARSVDQVEQPRRRVAPLLGDGPPAIGHPRHRRDAEPATDLDDHGGPSMQHRALRCIVWRASRPMSVEPLEVERACAEPEHPALERARRNANALGDTRQRAAPNQVGDGAQDDLDAGDLARQCVARQHPLAVPAVAATRQRHRERHECIAGLEPPLDPAASQPEIAAAAGRAPTADEQLVAGTIDDRAVLARLDLEYEDHVL